MEPSLIALSVSAHHDAWVFEVPTEDKKIIYTREDVADHFFQDPSWKQLFKDGGGLEPEPPEPIDERRSVWQPSFGTTHSSMSYYL